MSKKEKIAVIGAGITGLSAAYLLQHHYDVTLFEKEPRLGGHAHTVTTHDGTDVDSGFIVYNDWTYPHLIALFRHLNVPTIASTMSFSLSVDGDRLYYAGSASTLFAQKRNLIRPQFWLLLVELVRFYTHGKIWLRHNGNSTLSLGDFLKKYRYASIFIEAHLLPMAAAIWSTPDNRMLDFPAVSFLRFCNNHGLLNLRHRPIWRTVMGGSKTYIAHLLSQFNGTIHTSAAIKTIIRHGDGVTIETANDIFHVDKIVFATHADEALALLGDATQDEQDILGKFQYSHNETFVHTDPALMPRNKKIWSAWNYFKNTTDTGTGIFLSYWMNVLQPFIPRDKDIFVTLNPPFPPRADSIIRNLHYTHPQFDHGALWAQKNLYRIQNVRHTFFCGAYAGYGFHEDGLSSALGVAQLLDVTPPWDLAADQSSARQFIIGPHG